MSDDDFSSRMKKALLTRSTGWSRSLGPLPTSLGNANALRSTIRDETSRGAKLSRVELPAPALKEGQKGIVWTDWPSAAIGEDGSIEVNPWSVDEPALRTALLFADRVDVPDNNMISTDLESVHLLSPFDVVQRTKPIYEGDGAPAVKRHVFDAFHALEQREPGRWAIARGAQALGIPAGVLGPNTAFSIELNNALPIFDRDVPFDAVLEFKGRRLAELSALRTHMDELTRSVGHNGVEGIEGRAELAQFEQAIADHMKVMMESNAAKVLTSLKASISWDIAIPAITEVALTHAASGAGFVGGALTVAFKTVKGLIGRQSLSPFEYLTTVSRELY